jgi:hypothetical protein
MIPKWWSWSGRCADRVCSEHAQGMNLGELQYVQTPGSFRLGYRLRFAVTEPLSVRLRQCLEQTGGIDELA